MKVISKEIFNFLVIFIKLKKVSLDFLTIPIFFEIRTLTTDSLSSVSYQLFVLFLGWINFVCFDLFIKFKKFC